MELLVSICLLGIFGHIQAIKRIQPNNIICGSAPTALSDEETECIAYLGKKVLNNLSKEVQIKLKDDPCLCDFIYNFQFQRTDYLKGLFNVSPSLCNEESIQNVVNLIEAAKTIYVRECGLSSSTFTDSFSQEDIKLFIILGVSVLVAILAVSLSIFALRKTFMYRKNTKGVTRVPKYRT